MSKAFDNAEHVGSICWQIRQADYPRGMNRARINDLFNGKPPFSDEAVQRDRIAINVNPLTGTRLAHDARAQFYSAFLKPGRYFTATVDTGPAHKRGTWSAIVTKEMNRIMKRSLLYYEKFRSTFAQDVLHGIGPGAWRNEDSWCPSSVGVEDVGIPAKTLLTMENLPFFYVYRSLTGPELKRLTHDSKAAAASGWNMDVVENCIKWLDEQNVQLLGSNFPEVWSPEKVAERVKGDGGFYVGDQCPTIDAYDFYFYSEEGNRSGWCRRMVLDSWSSPPGAREKSQRRKDFDFAKNKFLFSSKSRKWADTREQIIHFQFADLSSVAPFQYHSVRSLGFLTYAVCHLQNRLFCRFNESVFEALMNYFRVKTADEAERALKIDLVNRGFIDDTVAFVTPDQRWKVDATLVELGMQETQKIIDSNSSSYTQNFNQASASKERKTRMQVMAEMNSMTALVAAALNQAYQYQNFEYLEVFRRFMRKNSRDVDVQRFRAACLRQAVDEKVLAPECWDVEPSRVMGAGNKTLEMAISEQLLQMRPLFDPEPQREILRDVVVNLTDDPARAERLVPDEPLKITDSVHDAQLAMGTLMMGLPVSIKTGMDHEQYVATLLQGLQLVIAQAQQQGGMMAPDKIQGCQLVAQHVQQHLAILGQDKDNKQFVGNAEKVLTKLMNEVRAFMQRLQEMAKKQQQANGANGEGAAKAQATIISAQTKAKLQQESHAQRTAQREIQFQREEKRRDEEFNREQARLDAETAGDIQRMHMEAITSSRLKTMQEGNDGN